MHNNRKSGLNVNVLAIRYCIDMRRQFSCDSKQEKKKKIHEFFCDKIKINIRRRKRNMENLKTLIITYMYVYKSGAKVIVLDY